MAQIRIENVRKEFGAFTAVQSSSFTVEDGEELMAYLRREGDFADPEASPRPGLILLDLNMPRKDGREALKEIKSDPLLRRIPVVVLTTSEAERDILRVYDLHANCYGADAMIMASWP